MARATPTEEIEEPRAVIHGVYWEAFEKILEGFGKCHARLSYNDGDLEILSPRSMERNVLCEAFSILIYSLANEMKLDYQPRGCATILSTTRRRGLDPDRSYYFANWRAVAGNYDMDVDNIPPPDLAVELELTPPLWVDRIAIHAALGTAELWRFDGRRLTTSVLVDGRYEARERSPLFPAIPLDELVPYILRFHGEPMLDWNHEFLAWVRGCLEA